MEWADHPVGSIAHLHLYIHFHPDGSHRYHSNAVAAIGLKSKTSFQGDRCPHRQNLLVQKGTHCCCANLIKHLVEFVHEIAISDSFYC